MYGTMTGHLLQEMMKLYNDVYQNELRKSHTFIKIDPTRGDEMKDLKTFLEDEGYTDIVELPSGELAGLMKFLFTTGLVVGLDEYGYRIRFCYEFTFEALEALKEWDGVGYPTGNWIKAKGRDENGSGVDDLNPNLENKDE